MKKMNKIGTALGLVFAGLLVIGCGSKEVGLDMDNAPDWVNNPPKTALAAVDTAPIGNSISSALNIATNKARTQIAANLQTTIEQKIRSLANTDSSGANEENIVNATRTTVEGSIAGAVKTAQYQDKEKNVWVLVEVLKVDTDLLQANLSKVKGVNVELAKQISQTVDELIDGKDAELQKVVPTPTAAKATIAQ